MQKAAARREPQVLWMRPEAQDTCLGLSLEGLSALMASPVFLFSSTVAVCVDISLLLAHTHEPSGLNSHCCKDMLEM